jgi:chromosome segregation ATPase
LSGSKRSHDIQGALEDVGELEEKLELMHQQNAGVIARNMELERENEDLREQREQAETRGLMLLGERTELEEQIKAKDDYIVKLQLRLIRIEAVAEQVNNAFRPGARLPHEQAKALTDLAIAVREQPAEPAPELNRLRGELLEVHDKLAHADNEIETLQQVIANLNEANATLAREREQASAHFNAAQREVERLKRERPPGEELAAMQALAHSKAEEVESLRFAAENAHQEIERLRQEVNVLETDRDFHKELAERLRAIEKAAQSYVATYDNSMHYGIDYDIELEALGYLRAALAKEDPLHRDDPAMDTRGKMA